MHKRTQTTSKPSASKSTPKKKTVHPSRNVKAPVSTASVMRTTQPRFRPSRPGSILVEKCEYIGEVAANTSTNYQIVGSYPINAGSGLTFPWLSALAQNFESYVFRELSFHYRTESPTSQPGYVGIVVDYNPQDPPPSTKVQAMDFEESVRGPVWTPFDHRCSQKNLHKRKTYFCRRDDISEADYSLYDTGTLYIIAGAQGSGGGAPPDFTGELWVRYVVEFTTPELDASLTVLDGTLTGTSTSGTQRASNLDTGGPHDFQLQAFTATTVNPGASSYYWYGPGSNLGLFDPVVEASTLKVTRFHQQDGSDIPPTSEEDVCMYFGPPILGDSQMPNLVFCRLFPNRTYEIFMSTLVSGGGTSLSGLSTSSTLLSDGTPTIDFKQTNGNASGTLANVGSYWQISTDNYPAIFIPYFICSVATGTATVTFLNTFFSFKRRLTGTGDALVPVRSQTAYERSMSHGNVHGSWKRLLTPSTAGVPPHRKEKTVGESVACQSTQPPSGLLMEATYCQCNTRSKTCELHRY